MAQQWSPESGPHWVRSPQRARELAAYLLDPARSRPVVVITVHPESAGPRIDADDVAGELRGIVPVAVVAASATASLAEGLGDRAPSVSYGAARLYPSGEEWLRNRAAAPLFLCPSAAQGVRVAQQLVAAALLDAHRAGLLAPPSAPAQDPKRETAKVIGFATEHHVLVRTEERQQGVLHAARLRVDVPADRLLRRGQHLTGTLGASGKPPQFLPEPPAIDVPALVRRECPNGATVPALVREVTDHWAQVLLHPDYPVVLFDEDEDLTRLISAGEVISVEVAWIDGSCLVALAQEARTLDALAILPGGPPWLALAEPERWVPAPAPEERVVESAPQNEDEAAARLAQARAAAEVFAEAAAALQAEVDALRRQARGLRANLRAARLAERNRELPQAFADAQQQFRWEVEIAYLEHVPESQRARYPLADYAVGRAFLGRLDTMWGVPRDKLLQLVVDVLCGRAQEMPSRQVQPVPVRGSGAQQERADGARAWRATLQVHSHTERRMKYWRLPDGRIELDSVGVHDDDRHR